MKFTMPFLFIVVMLVGLGCSSSTNPDDDYNKQHTSSKNRLTANGAGFTNSQWRGYITDSLNYAAANPADGVGSINIAGLTTILKQPFVCMILVQEAKPGTYQINSTLQNAITIQYGEQPATTLFASSGTIEVKQFGDVGGWAKGSFSGDFVSLDGKVTMTVTDGAFDVKVVDVQ